MDGSDHLGPRVLRVRAVDDVAERVRAFTLEAADGQLLPSWTPGAHLDLDLAPGLTRQYSLCGLPEAETLRIAVLREVESSGGSSYLHDHVRPGTLLTVRGPRNHFPLRDAPGYLFLAGGIGITPILAMVREVAAGSVPWRLVYAARSRPAMAFLDEPPLDRDKVELCCQDTDGLPDLAALIAHVTPETAIYACGPPAMLAAVTAACQAAGRSERLQLERFTSAGDAPPTAGATFEIELARSGTVLTVGPEQTILDTVRQVLPDHPSQCREGFCGTCETAVLGGVVDHRDTILSERERAANDTMMICVGRALSPRLVLDL